MPLQHESVRVSGDGPRDGPDRSGAEGAHDNGRAAPGPVLRRRHPVRQHRPPHAPQGHEPDYGRVRALVYLLHVLPAYKFTVLAF